MLLFLQLWTIGLSFLYFKSHLILRHNGMVVPSRYKAVVELVQAMHEGFEDFGLKMNDLTNRQLGSCISKKLAGGKVYLHLESFPAKYSVRKAFMSWIKQDKWWLGGLLILCVFDMFAWHSIGFGTFYWTVICWTLTIYVSITMGTTQRSRIFICFCGVCTSILFAIIYSSFNRS